MLLDLSFYWITRLDALQTICIIFAIVGIITGVVTTVLGMCFKYYALDDQDRKAGKLLLRVACFSLVLFIIGVLGSTFIPTTKEYCAIKFVDYLESNEKARELPDKIINKAYEYFDDELKVDDEEKK